MIAPDSSVLVAGADDHHPHFATATEALAKVRAEGRLVAHTLAETYNTLTSRVHGRHPERVLAYLGQFLERSPAGIDPAGYREALAELAAREITGPAIYDALIAVACRDGGLRLLSLDRRARGTYERCGVEYELLSS